MLRNLEIRARKKLFACDRTTHILLLIKKINYSSQLKLNLIYQVIVDD